MLLGSGLYRQATLFFMAMLFISCTSESPTRKVSLSHGMLEMVISESWKLETTDSQSRVYTHVSHDDARLHISSQLEEFGSPMRVVHVKAMIGKELNLEFGGVRTRVSLGGNAMMDYSREVLVDDAPLHAREWVLARPVGFSDIARVLISLQVPPARQSDPSILEMIEILDKQVGDARIPRA